MTKSRGECIILGIIFGYHVWLDKSTREIFWDTEMGRTRFSVDHDFIKSTALRAAALRALGEEHP